MKTIEFGGRAILFNNLFADASYYYSFYKYFIGYKLGADVNYDQSTSIVTSTQVYRVAANSEEQVTTQGFSIGLTYFFKRYYSIGGNYSWNVLNQKDSIDPIIPAFNTPEHKYNLTFSGRDIDMNLLACILETGVTVSIINGFKDFYTRALLNLPEMSQPTICWMLS